MSKFRDWSLGAKLLTLAMVGFLLMFGLCSVGTPFMGHGTKAQDFAAEAGLISFLVSVTMVGVGVIALIVKAISGK